MSSPSRLHLFEGTGVEIEYMIVDCDTLDVRPVADQLFQAALGLPGSDVEGPVVSWSNELVNHVVELKTTEPVSDLESVRPAFESEIGRMNALLAPMGCRLMPTAMHPWMNPLAETHLWPGENNEIYAAFDRIFDCRGHGWSNLQSMHLNLPFTGDEEFGRLHTAVRLVLPLIPAIAASSPYEQGVYTGYVDNRLRHYFANTERIREVAGDIVPELVLSEEEYHDRIFHPMWDAIAPYDPNELMREEWLNARGAIARFERGSIEIRVIDSQEHPRADLARARLILDAVRGLVEERWSSFEAQKDVAHDTLIRVLQENIRNPADVYIRDDAYLDCFGMHSPRKVRAIWSELSGESANQMSLAEWLLDDAGPAPTRAELRRVYRRLCDCLACETSFHGEGRGGRIA